MMIQTLSRLRWLLKITSHDRPARAELLTHVRKSCKCIRRSSFDERIDLLYLALDIREHDLITVSNLFAIDSQIGSREDRSLFPSIDIRRLPSKDQRRTKCRSHHRRSCRCHFRRAFIDRRQMRDTSGYAAAHLRLLAGASRRMRPGVHQRDLMAEAKQPVARRRAQRDLLSRGKSSISVRSFVRLEPTVCDMRSTSVIFCEAN